MIIHAPHQFPQGIRYSIYCSQPLSSLAPIPKVNRAPSTGFVSFQIRKCKKFLLKAARKLKLIRLWDAYHIPTSGTIEKTLALKLRNILVKFRPGSQFMGFQSDFTQNGAGHSIVLFSWNWRTIKHELISHGWRPDHILIMSVPESDPWAYWNNEHFLQTDERGNVVFSETMKNPDFLDHLVEQNVLLRGSGYKKYRDFTNRSLEGMLREHHVYPFPSFATDVISKHLDKISQVELALSDSQSKIIYRSVLFGTPEDRFRYYFANTLANLQYFEYIHIEPGDCIVNAGVAGGSEIPIFCTHLDNAGMVYCLDPGGFDHLSPYVNNFYNAHKSLLSTDKFVVCDRSTGACPKPRIGDFSNCLPIAIDDFVEQKQMPRVDLIKTDIEGMESIALEKMRKTVAKFRPQMVISVYHEVEHFWELPLQIMDMCKDYDFYFNIYSPTHFEGIFYAIPKEKKHKSGRLGNRIQTPH